jgi:beta-lactamase regulating signal transducer with metallopeptidase domain
MLADLFRTVAEVTLSTSCLVAVLLPLSPYLKKHFTVNCLLIIWLILSARLVIPYSIQFPDSVLRIPVPALSQQENALVNANPEDNGRLNQLSPAPVITPPEQPSQEPGFDLSAKQAETMLVQNIVEVIWAAGAGLYITIHAAGYVLLRRSIRRYSKTVEDKELLDVFESIRHQLKLSGRRISLMIYGKIKSPIDFVGYC